MSTLLQLFSFLYLTFHSFSARFYWKTSHHCHWKYSLDIQTGYAIQIMHNSWTITFLFFDFTKHAAEYGKAESIKIKIQLLLWTHSFKSIQNTSLNVFAKGNLITSLLYGLLYPQQISHFLQLSYNFLGQSINSFLQKSLLSLIILTNFSFHGWANWKWSFTAFCIFSSVL